MAEIIRLKNWRTYLSDGRSSVTYSTGDKSQVAVAVIVGYEPLKIEKDSDWCPVDDIIADMGKHVQAARTKRKRKKTKS